MELNDPSTHTHVALRCRVRWGQWEGLWSDGRSLTCRVLFTDEAHEFHEGQGDALFVQIFCSGHTCPVSCRIHPLFIQHLPPLHREMESFNQEVSNWHIFMSIVNMKLFPVVVLTLTDFLWQH